MLNVSQKHLQIIKELLKNNLSDSHRVYVFGSRVKKHSQPFSDIDLCVDGSVIPFLEMLQLKQLFSESDLPFSVDLVQKNELDSDFLNSIQVDFIKIYP